MLAIKKWWLVENTMKWWKQTKKEISESGQLDAIHDKCFSLDGISLSFFEVVVQYYDRFKGDEKFRTELMIFPLFLRWLDIIKSDRNEYMSSKDNIYKFFDEYQEVFSNNFEYKSLYISSKDHFRAENFIIPMINIIIDHDKYPTSKAFNLSVDSGGDGQLMGKAMTNYYCKNLSNYFNKKFWDLGKGQCNIGGKEFNKMKDACEDPQFLDREYSEYSFEKSLQSISTPPYGLDLVLMSKIIFTFFNSSKIEIFKSTCELSLLSINRVNNSVAVYGNYDLHFESNKMLRSLNSNHITKKCLKNKDLKIFIKKCVELIKYDVDTVKMMSSVFHIFDCLHRAVKTGKIKIGKNTQLEMMNLIMALDINFRHSAKYNFVLLTIFHPFFSKVLNSNILNKSVVSKINQNLKNNNVNIAIFILAKITNKHKVITSAIRDDIYGSNTTRRTYYGAEKKLTISSHLLLTEFINDETRDMAGLAGVNDQGFLYMEAKAVKVANTLSSKSGKILEKIIYSRGENNLLVFC